jgi:xylan 1,4-beta-xylosidase
MNITVQAHRSTGKIDPYWTRCVGSCHAATALREDWRRQLETCHAAFGFQYVRFHGLLDDDMSVCLANEKGELEYSFFNIDSIFDFLLGIGMKPFIELSFMPKVLASGNKTVFHYLGNITPPQSYERWADLIGALGRHLVDRYGIAEVAQWFFEVWNEPNLEMFWSGTQAEYFQLYETAARALKKVDARLPVGGPSTAIDAWIPEFRAFCDKGGVPLDFITTHHYPTDAAFGLGLDMEEQMARSERGVLTRRARQARAESAPLPLYYTEWNNSPSPRDPYHDKPYNAAFIIKTIPENLGLVDCYSFWTFTDIFEESGFSSWPFHGGFGLLNIHGIPKPSYRAFELLQHLAGERLAAVSDGASPTVDFVACRNGRELVILLSNHNIPKSPIHSENISVIVQGVGAIKGASLYRIDDTHANPEKAWRAMGSPQYLNASQVKDLQKASEMAAEPVSWQIEDSAAQIDMVLPPHAAAGIILTLQG